MHFLVVTALQSKISCAMCSKFRLQWVKIDQNWFFKVPVTLWRSLGYLHVPECVARVPVSFRFTLGVCKAVFAKSCVCVRNRTQRSATVGNHLRDCRKALLNGERGRRALEIESSGLVTSHVNDRRLQGTRCLCQ